MEASSIQKFIKIAGGTLTHLGFEAQSDYGSVFIPWMNISHVLLAIFERASKGQASPYLIILQKDTERVYYIDSLLVNYRELLCSEAADIPEQNLKILIRAILPDLYETYIEPGVFFFLKGLSHLLKRFSNLKQLGDFCDAMKAKAALENCAVDERVLWDFSILDKQKHVRKRRSDAFLIATMGFNQLEGIEDEPEIRIRFSDFLPFCRVPEDFFACANRIDPYCHLAHAGLSLCACERGDLPRGLRCFQNGVDCLPYPGGISEEQISYYSSFLRRMSSIAEEESDFLLALERLLAFSPQKAFFDIIAPLYDSLKISPDWYLTFQAALSSIAAKKYTQAFEPLEKILHLQPGFLWAYHWQGVALSRLGRPGEARRAFQQVLERLKSQDYAGSSATFMELFLIDKNRENRIAMEQALRANPRSAWMHYLLGNNSLVHEKNIRKGLYYFLRAISIDPSDILAQKMQGDMLEFSSHSGSQSKQSHREELKRGDYLSPAYQITQIFMGGMGIVYIAYEAASNTHYAVKTFQEQFLWDKSIIDMFVNEAETWIKLEKHRHIVQACFIKIIDEKPYLFLEFVRGSDLEKLLEKGPLPVDRSLDFALQFCNGMNYAYQKLGIVHRDIKPSNCLITQDGVLKITDFGLVRVFSDRTKRELTCTAESLPDDFRVTNTRSFMGTIVYMAPERLLYMEQGDIRSDVYSFGVMCYRMLTGRFPFDPEELMQDFSLIISSEPAPPHEVNKKVPFELGAIVTKCLREDPAERFRDFEDLESSFIEVFEKLTTKKYESTATMGDISLDDLIVKGNSLISIGDYGAALRTFEQALEQAPGLLSAIAGKSNALLKMGRYGGAISGFDRILAEKPDSVDILRNKAVALMEIEAFDDALKCLGRILVYFPSDAIAWWKRGVIARKKGQFEEALRYYDKSLLLDNRLFAAWNDRGTLLMELGRLSDSIECFDRALEINPAATEVLSNKGYALVKFFHFEEALIQFEQIFKLEPHNFDALLGKGMALEGLDNFEEALKFYDKILSRHPGHIKALVNKARICKALGALEAALDIYERLRGEDPSDCAHLLEEAIILKSLFFHEEAMARIREFLTGVPGHLQATEILGEIRRELESIQSLKSEFLELSGFQEDEIASRAGKLLEEGKSREALEILNRVLGFHPGMARLLILKGQVLEKQLRPAEALLAFDEALSRMPGNDMIMAEHERVLQSIQRTKKSGHSPGILKKIFTSGEDPGETLHTSYERIRKGVFYHQKGDFKSAVRYFDDSLKVEPESAAAWYYKGLALRSAGMYEEAMECIDASIERDDSMAETWCDKGEVEEKMGRSAESLSCYERSLHLNPLYLPAWIDLIFYSRELGHVKKSLLYAMCALDLIERWEQANPDAPGKHSVKALLQYILGRYARASNSCERALQEDADSYEGLYLRSLIHRLKVEYTEALQCLERVTRRFPEDIAVMLQIGHLYELQGDPEQALEHYDCILERFPMQEATLYRKSMLLFEQGIYEEAMHCLDEILEFRSRSSLMLKAKGLFNYRQGKEEDALWCYRKVVDYLPEDFVARHNLIILSNRWGRSEEVGTDVEYLVNTEPFNPGVWILRGDFFLSTGNDADAEDSYRRAIEIDPDLLEGYIHKAILHHSQGQNDQALATLEEGLKKYPSHKFLLNNYAYILFQMGSRSEALDFLEKALLSDSRNEIILYNKAVLLILQNRLDEAAICLDSALCVDTTFIDGLIARGLLCEMMGLPQDALSFYEQGIKQDPKNAYLLLYRGNALLTLNRNEEALRSLNQSMRVLQDAPLVWLDKGLALQKLERRSEAGHCFNRYRELTDGAAPEELSNPPEYERESLFALKAMGHSMAILEDEPKEILRSVDFDFMQGDVFFRKWTCF